MDTTKKEVFYWAKSFIIGKMIQMYECEHIDAIECKMQCGDTTLRVLLNDANLVDLQREEKSVVGKNYWLNANIKSAKKSPEFLNFVLYAPYEGKRPTHKEYFGTDFKASVVGQGKVLKQEGEKITVSISKKIEDKILVLDTSKLTLNKDNLTGKEISFKGSITSGSGEFNEWGEPQNSLPIAYVKEIQIIGGGEEFKGQF